MSTALGCVSGAFVKNALILTCDGISAEENALQGVMTQVFESLGVNSN